MMIKKKFETTIVIGTGQFAFNCAQYLQNTYELECVYEYGNYIQSRLEVLCNKNHIPYIHLSNKIEGNNLMYEIEKRGTRMLIVSASNIYIFPKHITRNANIEIINYHPALLTKHLGRNAEAWAIYGQDQVTGVTWHKVTEHIDQGIILAENIFDISKEVTSVKLMLKQYQIGYESFKELVGKLFDDKEIKGVTKTIYGKMHYSYEKPNNGILDLSWDESKISAFLRSMDYGSMNVLGRPILIENNIKYCWDYYRIISDQVEDCDFEECKIIRKENISFVLGNYHKVIEGESV